jgi:hypothetical protein
MVTKQVYAYWYTDISLFAFCSSCYVTYCYMNILCTKAIEDNIHKSSYEWFMILIFF